ncbi:MAG: sigma-54-dependent Fis family transcriptional regulator, partial [Deltaproteobacteria bacterium]|nr:sigma-54-dependent Fis family transcriptional regulator [Deltaproteobacteria bacterium]
NRMVKRLKESMMRLAESNERLEHKNEELDRAHRQLTASFAITQDIAALPDLSAISRYLIEKFKRLVKCQSMALVIHEAPAGNWFVCVGRRIQSYTNGNWGKVYDKLHKIDTLGFLPVRSLGDLLDLDDSDKIERLAAFPFRYHGQLQGALLIGCPGDCSCAKKEMEIISLLLNQTSGAIKRAVSQETECRDLRARIDRASGFGDIIGKDPEMQTVYQLIEDVAPTDATVLIQGESGTGKELVARAIHDRSTRKDRPFVVINCAAYPSTLLESELFGHEKGAFTGAVAKKAGRFELADGGTVLLDEIGEISASAQIKLLRVLQTQKFERVGGEKTLEVDVRILAATNKNLLQHVKGGAFREDLYYRLNVILFNLPPLRKRRNDIPLLAKYFLEQFALEQDKTVHDFDQNAMRFLLDYNWPGNVRELENSVEHAVVLAKDRVVLRTDLPSAILEAGSGPASSHPVARQGSIVENEENLIRKALEECEWNKTATAVQLGISRSTLYEKLKKYQIEKPTLH